MKLDWKGPLGVLISAALLWWLFRDQDARAIVARLASADPVPFAGAVVIATAGFLIRALRWRVLLSPLSTRTALRSRWAAVNIGFMVNNFIPGRVPGEVARAYALGRMESLDAAGALATLVMERILDSVALLTLLALALLSPAFPLGATVGGRSIGAAVWLMVVVLAGGVAFLGLVIARPDVFIARATWFLRPLPEPFVRRVTGGLRGFIAGLDLLRRPRALLEAFLWSLFLWLWMSASFLVAFRAFDIDLGFTAAVFTQCAVSVFAAIPAAPGFIGTLHAGVAVSLIEVFGVASEPTLSLAVAYHIGALLPVTLIGLWYAWSLGIGVGRVAREAVVREGGSGT